VNSKTIIFWAVGVAIVFGILWWQGQIRRLSTYWQEMLEELKKCSWPTWTELKGSTVVIIITIFIIGGLTYVTDVLFTILFQKIIY
jgi:preprotein translocase subunit SecE